MGWWKQCGGKKCLVSGKEREVCYARHADKLQLQYRFSAFQIAIDEGGRRSKEEADSMKGRGGC